MYLRLTVILPCSVSIAQPEDATKIIIIIWFWVVWVILPWYISISSSMIHLFLCKDYRYILYQGTRLCEVHNANWCPSQYWLWELKHSVTAFLMFNSFESSFLNPGVSKHDCDFFLSILWAMPTGHHVWLSDSFESSFLNHSWAMKLIVNGPKPSGNCQGSRRP